MRCQDGGVLDNGRILLPAYVHEWAADAWCLRAWELRAIRPGHPLAHTPATMRALAALLDGRTSGPALFWPWALRALADAWEGL